MEGCSERTAGAESGIPDDPLLDILSRVPAKSVCRFKCVSKAWRDLIEDPDNRKKLRQPMQGLFVQTWEYSEVDENELNRVRVDRVSFSFIDLTVRSMPLDIDPCFSFLTEMTGIETFCFKDSCNGLILFRHYYQEWPNVGDYIVCNPTTKQWSAVPACGSDEPLTYAYLAFDPAISSHFHLVQLQMPRWEDEEIVSVHVYSSETETWSQNQINEQEEEQGQLGGWDHQFTLDTHAFHGAFVNGFLHLIVWSANRHHILVVDIQGKARRMIAPGMADGSRRHNMYGSRRHNMYGSRRHNITCYLGQSQGHLHCVTIESTDKSNAKLSTYVLQDYDTEQWVLKNTVDLNSLDFFGGTEETPLFHVVDIHQDRNVVLFLYNYRKLAAYDMDRKEASVIATFKDRKDPWDFARYVPYFSESPDLANKY